MNTIRKNSGFSIIELLVGIMIGLLILLAAVSSASLFEANRKNAIGSNGALENGIAAIFNIQKDIKIAGFGSGLPNPGCDSAFTAVNITDPQNSNSSSIAIQYFQVADLNDASSACTKKTNTYSISNNNLQLNDGANDIVIAENIVRMKAQYGIISAGSNAITSWVNSNNLAGQTPRAIRVTVIARSPVKNKKIKDADGNAVCDTTSSAPLSGLVPIGQDGAEDWTNSPDNTNNTVTFDFTNDTDWGCYSYKTVNLTIPMKNILMTSN